MIISEVTLSYPCIQHKVEVSHFTARKSTAIEWVILEAINKCETLTQYEGISIAAFFEQIFTIADADQLIRPCLIDLQDMGAIRMSRIDDETELSTVPMRRLKLTDTGREMQRQGLLPGVTAEDTFTIYYDLVSRSLREEANIYKDVPTGIKAMDMEQEEMREFPASEVREWLLSMQRNKNRNRLNWLAPTTRIQDIVSLDSKVLWKNSSRKIELTEGLVWKVVGEEDDYVNELTLTEANLSCPEEFSNLPTLDIVNPDQEMERLVPISEINVLIRERLTNDDLFCVEEKHYKSIRPDNLSKRKKLRFGIVYGAEKFEVESKNKQIIMKVPEQNISSGNLYRNAKESIQAGVITVTAGNTSRDMAIAYIPKNNAISLATEIVTVVDKYYREDYNILFALTELGMKELFLEYAEKIVGKEQSLSKKAEVIEEINSKSVGYYNQKMISAIDKERLLVNEAYIADKVDSLNGAKAVLEEYGEINSFRQDENLFQRIIKIVLEHLEGQDKPEDIWSLWATIAKNKKSFMSWIGKSGLYKEIYSATSIKTIFQRFSEENVFEIEEYTPVEQIFLNLNRIYIKVQELLPELELKKISSEETINEIVLQHKDSMNDLYDQVRQWRDEEEKLNHKIMAVEELLEFGGSFSYIKNSFDGLRNALSLFFDDSFMRYSKVYIVDTCTLLHEPALFSWFDDEKALLVVPMIVLDELDGLKASEDDEVAYAAREVIRNISNYKAYGWLNIGEESYPDLLSKDIDAQRNDNKILSIALRYSAKKPILLTDDINLGNIADAHSIQNMDLDTYCAMKEHEKLSQKNSGKKAKKKGKKG